MNLPNISKTLTTSVLKSNGQLWVLSFSNWDTLHFFANDSVYWSVPECSPLQLLPSSVCTAPAVPRVSAHPHHPPHTSPAQGLLLGLYHGKHNTAGLPCSLFFHLVLYIYSCSKTCFGYICFGRYRPFAQGMFLFYTFFNWWCWRHTYKYSQ